MPLPEETPPASDQVRIRRLPARGRYDRAAVDAVLDAARVAHVGVVVDGRPVVIPMVFCRDADRLVLHGSVASRLLRSLAAGVEVCVTVTLVDGLVLARSTFHHSVNYRSVVVMGVARPIEDEEARRAALDALVEFLVPGRTADRAAAEPGRAEADPAHRGADRRGVGEGPHGRPGRRPRRSVPPVWAGVVPLTELAGPPEADPLLASDVPVPDTSRRPLAEAGRGPSVRRSCSDTPARR